MAEPFTLGRCAWIGFDLDHTIIQYKLDNLVKFVSECFVNFLVEQEHYDASLFADLPIGFAAKGVIIDKQLGNFIKIDEQKRVVRMYHGTQPQSVAEIASVYSGPIDFAGITNARFWPMTTYFEVSLGPLFALMVDYEDTQQRKDYVKHTVALYNALVFNFSRWGSGWFFEGLKRDPGRYFYRVPQIVGWLRQLRSHGRKVFLLTNSLPEYTDLLLSYAFADVNWIQHFDLVICYARKPTFFTGTSPFISFQFGPSREIRVSGAEIDMLDIEFQYLNGNARALLESLRFLSATSDNDVLEARPAGADFEVCYFGDHLNYDITVPRTALRWHTVAIVEELHRVEREAGFAAPQPEVLPSDGPYHDSVDSVWGSFFAENDQPTYWSGVLRVCCLRRTKPKTNAIAAFLSCGVLFVSELLDCH
eukprot:TRINITY_DN5878_c0_g1_i1.p1 TRINITY_DN5878_c0_g1~~TRINITY_DN5878_c0_g1_i1.p1  ORF type:complete len:428 (-),score=69.62 TRINITY_DN5878_c0_g1_i1:477-1736(-)